MLNSEQSQINPEIEKRVEIFNEQGKKEISLINFEKIDSRFKNKIALLGLTVCLTSVLAPFAYYELKPVDFIDGLILTGIGAGSAVAIGLFLKNILTEISYAKELKYKEQNLSKERKEQLKSIIEQTNLKDENKKQNLNELSDMNNAQADDLIQRILNLQTNNVIYIEEGNNNLRETFWRSLDTLDYGVSGSFKIIGNFFGFTKPKEPDYNSFTPQSE